MDANGFSPAELELLAAVAAHGRDATRRIADDELRAMARAKRDAAKRAAATVERDNERERAEWQELVSRVFAALDDVRDAYATRRTNGADAFRAARARYDAAALLPIPAHALALSPGGRSPLVNYAATKWHNYATTRREDDDAMLTTASGERITAAGFGVTSVNHSGVIAEPVDAVQAALLTMIEDGNGATMGSLFRSIAIAAARMSRGRDVWHFADTHAAPDVPAYDVEEARRELAAAAPMADHAIEAARDAIAEADERDAANTARDDRRDVLANMLAEGPRAIVKLLRAGFSLERISVATGKSVERLTREVRESAANGLHPRAYYV